jgi:hypothetical protein
MEHPFFLAFDPIHGTGRCKMLSHVETMVSVLVADQLFQEKSKNKVNFAKIRRRMVTLHRAAIFCFGPHHPKCWVCRELSSRSDARSPVGHSILVSRTRQTWHMRFHSPHDSTLVLCHGRFPRKSVHPGPKSSSTAL